MRGPRKENKQEIRIYLTLNVIYSVEEEQNMIPVIINEALPSPHNQC